MTDSKNDTQITNYTMDDCLPPLKVAKKFGISTARVNKIMRLMEMNNEQVKYKSIYKNVIVRKAGSSTKRLHPLGFGIFEEYNKKVKQ